MLMLLNGKLGSKALTREHSPSPKIYGDPQKNLDYAKHWLIEAIKIDGTFPTSCHRHEGRRIHIAQTVKDTVFEFWIDEKRAFPNKNYVCIKRATRCLYVKHTIHLLKETSTILVGILCLSH